MVKNKFKILLMFGLCGFLPAFIARSIDLALPCMAKEFDMNIIAISWVITAYLLATSVLVIPFGRLADIVGRKKIFTAGALLFAITATLCSIAPSGQFLIIVRILQGAAAAMIFGTSNALLVTIFPPQERGKAIGLNVAGVYLGSSLGPSLGGIMTQYFGWRSLFMPITALGAVVVALAYIYLERDIPEAHDESFDFIGSLLYAIAMIALLYGTTLLPQATGYLMIALGITLFIAFCVAEEYIKHPVFDIKLIIKNKAFALAGIAALLNFSASFALMFLMSLYLQYVRCIDPKIAGLILLASPITIFVGSPIAGRLADRNDPRIIASIGMALSSVALFAMSFAINPATPIYFIMALLFVFGTGAALFASPNTHAAMSCVAKRHLGVAASVINTMRLFGQTISMGIATLVLALFIGKVEITCKVLPELMQSIKVTLSILGTLCLAGAFASLTGVQRKAHVGAQTQDREHENT